MFRFHPESVIRTCLLARPKAALICVRATQALLGTLRRGHDMPEFMGKKITRAEESARHAYRRSLEKSVRTQARNMGWKSASGSIFKEQADWFIEASPSVYIYEHLTKAVISVKPMVIDSIFWDIVGLPENRQQPLSFRENGAWTCRPPYFAEPEIESTTITLLLPTGLSPPRPINWKSCSDLTPSRTFYSRVAMRQGPKEAIFHVSSPLSSL